MHQQSTVLKDLQASNGIVQQNKKGDAKCIWQLDGKMNVYFL